MYVSNFPLSLHSSKEMILFTNKFMLIRSLRTLTNHLVDIKFAACLVILNKGYE